jgi:hypothetical protein
VEFRQDLQVEKKRICPRDR